MRVLNVNSSIELRGGGGTAERSFQMSLFLAKEGVDCTMLTLDIGLDASRVEAIRPAKVVSLASLWKRFYVPKPGWKAIWQLVEKSDIVHLMGHWSVLNVLVYVVVRRVGKPYVVCPAGALPLFGRSAWLKRMYNRIIGYAIIRNASAWIAVTSGELWQFESYGIVGSSVTVIPNGVNEVGSTLDYSAFLAKFTLPDAPFILFMGRLNAIKGPDLLLEAFASVSNGLVGYQLVFAGPDGGMLAELRFKADQWGLTHRVHFLGHIEGDAKASAYRFARLLVVPSRQEAMSIVALEAGICGTPVLLTDRCGFDEIAEVDPRFVVSASKEGLSGGLRSLLDNGEELHEVGLQLSTFVRSRYAWPVIIGQYLALYHRILSVRSHL